MFLASTVLPTLVKSTFGLASIRKSSRYLSKSSKSLSLAPPLTDSVGKVSYQGVRISYVNGLSNSEYMCKEAASRLSKIHGEAQVVFVHYPTLGLWNDLWHVGRFTLTRNCPAITATAFALSCAWSKMIQEMENETSTPKIIHYGHSFGGVLTLEAAKLNPTLMRFLDLRLFGSPWLLPNTCFHSLQHVANSKDRVTWLCHLQPGRLSKWETLVYTPTSSSSTQSWREHHHLFGNSYKKVIENMGEAFVSKYVLTNKKSISIKARINFPSLRDKSLGL